MQQNEQLLKMIEKSMKIQKAVFHQAVWNSNGDSETNPTQFSQKPEVCWPSQKKFQDNVQSAETTNEESPAPVCVAAQSTRTQCKLNKHEDNNIHLVNLNKPIIYRNPSTEKCKALSLAVFWTLRTSARISSCSHSWISSTVLSCSYLHAGTTGT